jgi:hypothetical protein
MKTVYIYAARGSNVKRVGGDATPASTNSSWEDDRLCVCVAERGPAENGATPEALPE